MKYGETEKQDGVPNEVEAVRESTYHGDRVRTGEGCEAVVIARTIYGWLKLTESGNLLHGWRSQLRLIRTAYKINARTAIHHGKEALC